MNRRSFLAVAGASLLPGCTFTLSDGILNACATRSRESLRVDPVVTAAWRGLDPANVWDVHCHVFGNGDSGSGLWVNPALERLWPITGYLQRYFYINASCTRDVPGEVDRSAASRLREQCEAMPQGFRALVLAFDWARDANGRPDREQSTFYVPDDYCADLAARYPDNFVWAASIHPYDPAAIDRLDAAVARGARALKWLPSAQNIDPSSPRCARFYARMAELKLPLITHAGDEKAVRGFGEALGNPLRLRRPLDAGVRVVVAHCASLGSGVDVERGNEMRPNFELFTRLMDDPRYDRNLSADISAVTQGNRAEVLTTLLRRRDWHSRLRNGSDYPLPGVVPLVSLPLLVDRGLLDPAAVAPLKALRDHNVLMFDFVLKRSVVNNGVGFANSVFETRSFFT